MTRKQTPPPSLPAISRRLAALVLALWLVCMAAITLGTTQYIFKDLSRQGIELAQQVCSMGGFDSLYSRDPADEQRQVPGIVEYSINRAIDLTAAGVSAPSYDGYPSPYFPEALNIYGDSWAKCETAVLFLDRDHQIVRQSGDFIYFHYVTADDWQAGEEIPSACGWIDLGNETDSRYSLFRTSYAGTHSLYDLPILRLTGYFDGSRFEPAAMALMTLGAYYNALNSAAPGWDTADTGVDIVPVPPYSMSELDAMGLIAWDTHFDLTAEAEPGQELVPIYVISPNMSLYEPAGPVHYQKTEEHENLLSLLSTMEFYADKGRDAFFDGASKFNLWDLILFSSWKVYDKTGWNPESGAPLPEAEYTILTALRASPLRIAMRFLKNVYIVTFSLALAGFLLIRRSIKKNLTSPLREINAGIASGWHHLPELRDNPPKWEEPRTLAKHYAQTQSALYASKAEITRLQTALDYAKSAEQNRRRMTSNIAHELKTPLAVVHSYAEGLKEHIAEEKRDRYLDIILAETERMDLMVLEMLDLSRLEAGKVKLSHNDFSLAALTGSIFEKLEMAAMAKDLHISYDFPTPCVITADESRISQVIENLSSNAIKYTPIGGSIVVKIQIGSSQITFSIENESEPLPREALAKVWDSFYRTDESRLGGGTGLGLAIVKSIIELHSGSCFVRNTKTGVEFSFTLPR